jgi:uncharacterized alkaline shock family protein YloU
VTAAPDFSVARRVVVEMVALAAIEVPGVVRVGRGGRLGGVRSVVGRGPVFVRVRDGAVEARIWVIARPNQSLVSMARDVRLAVSAAVERLLGLRVSDVSVVVDGVGA